MGTAAIAVMAFAIVLVAAFTSLGNVVELGITSADSMRSSWKEAERVVDSSVTPTSVDTSVTLLIADISIVVANEGRIKYSEQDLKNWEVIIRYQDTLGVEQVEYFSHSGVLAPGNWNVEGIYLDESTTTGEVYEPGIFNPNEEIVITARLMRILGVGTVNQATIAPAEGPRRMIEFNG